MKLFSNLKKEKSQIHLIAITMLIIGILGDWLGYINIGVEIAGASFLILSTIFIISLFIKNLEDNHKYIKRATIHLTFIVIGIIGIFASNYFKMYWTLAAIACMLILLIVLYIIDLFEIYDIYNS